MTESCRNSLTGLQDEQDENNLTLSLLVTQYSFQERIWNCNPVYPINPVNPVHPVKLLPKSKSLSLKWTHNVHSVFLTKLNLNYPILSISIILSILLILLILSILSILSSLSKSKSLSLN